MPIQGLLRDAEGLSWERERQPTPDSNWKNFNLKGKAGAIYYIFQQIPWIRSSIRSDFLLKTWIKCFSNVLKQLLSVFFNKCYLNNIENRNTTLHWKALITSWIVLVFLWNLLTIRKLPDIRPIVTTEFKTEFCGKIN